MAKRIYTGRHQRSNYRLTYPLPLSAPSHTVANRPTSQLETAEGKKKKRSIPAPCGGAALPNNADHMYIHMEAPILPQPDRYSINAALPYIVLRGDPIITIS